MLEALVRETAGIGQSPHAGGGYRVPVPRLGERHRPWSSPERGKK